MFYLPSYILFDVFFCQEYFIEKAQNKICHVETVKIKLLIQLMKRVSLSFW